MLRKLIAVVLALTAMVSLREPVLAQSTEPADISLEASIGLDGWVEFSEPVRFRVTIRSELLFSGSLELRQGQAVVATPVEVPAGGEKAYELLISPTMATQPITVQLVTADDAKVASARVGPKDPAGQLLVGTLGFAEEVDLPRATSIASVPIVELRLNETDTDLAVLDYLVVASGGKVPESVLSWVAAGGRLIVQPGVANDMVGTSAIAKETRPNVYAFGAGWILEQSDPIPSAEEWGSLLVPFREQHLSDLWGSPEIQMIRAASNSGKPVLPYSGTLIGLVIYAIVVAPVNLIVLRRLRRRELAWITVPVISLVAVVAFAVVGFLSDDSTDWGQATIVAGRGDSSESLSVIAAAANGSLTHTLSTNAGSVIYPAATADTLGAGGRSAVRRVMSDEQVDLVFGEAGYGTVAVLGPTADLPVVSVDGSSIHVQNRSPYIFEVYGVVAGASVTVGPGSLGSGGETTIAQNNQTCMFCPLAEAVAMQTGFWNDSRRWQTYEPLSSAAFGLVGDNFFFGFVDNLPLAMMVNGESRTIDGPGIVVVQVSEGIDIGHASPQIVATSPDSTIQGEGFVGQWLTGEWALLEFTVPVEREITLSHNQDMFGPAPSIYEAWDWTEGAFKTIEPGKLEHQRFVDSEGAVLIRIAIGEDNEFFGGFPISSISVTWDADTG